MERARSLPEREGIKRRLESGDFKRVVWMLEGRECVFLETASGARSFPVPAGNDLRAEVAVGRNTRDRPAHQTPTSSSRKNPEA